MTSMQTDQQLFQQFSRLFCYPDADTEQTVTNCYELLAQKSPVGAEQLRNFKEFIEVSAPARREETFTATFELQPLCHPYVAWQLCGESQQRTLLLMKLNELYRQHEFSAGNDLPDHLSEVLRFIGTSDDVQCHAELVADAIIPTLDKMIAAIEKEDHPYRSLLVALHNWLCPRYEDKGVLS
jgi:nitrate reductase molybdenum cofactor assembly chaperone NarJ/NarW